MLYSGWVILVFFIFPGLISSQTPNLEENVCARSSCYPATGDLMVGRAHNLTASSTCGLNGRPEEFCIISRLQGSKDCSICDARKTDEPPVYAHLPSYMLISFGGSQTWWQSENGKENVYLQLNFEAQFHVTHIVMKFKSFRPAAMLIERSYDYGKSWEVSRYFAKDCKLSFPDIPTSIPLNSSETYCTQGYSSIEPSSGGEVVYKALNTRIPDSDAWKPKVQNLLRMTNIRINFTKLNTLGDDIIDDSPEIRKKYFYAVEWLSIRGSCSCYGHAKRCLPAAGETNVPDMVHSICECTHNTAGLNCERCKDGYQDRPWSPAFRNNPNECKKCECNGHSDKCRFDRAVWKASGETSGGVCLDCQHNTIGPKCEKCKPLHYQDPTKTIRDPDVCIACDCDPVGSVGLGECQMEDKPSNGLRAGQCICKKNVAGTRCDTCKIGFYNLQRDNPDGCQACGCNLFGTVGNNCDAESGQCQCKRHVVGQFCDSCKVGYWGLETDRGCQPCDCDVGGSYDNLCNAVTGQCRCRPGIEGRKCNRVIPGYYFALSDNLRYEAEKARGVGVTSINLIERPTGTKVHWTDVGSLSISDGNGVEFEITNVPLTGNYKLLLRFYPQTESEWDGIKVGVSRADGRVTTNSECVNSLPSNGNTFITIQRYESVKVIEQLVCFEKGVDYFVRVDFNRHGGAVDHVYLDSLVLIPTMESVSIFQGENGQTRLDDFKRLNCERPHIRVNHIPPTIDPECRKLHFSGSAVIYDGALSCNCNKMGTIKNSSGIYQCNVAGGQCPCKPNVIGRRCDKCAPGSHSFSTSGCKLCNCDLRGSLDNLCNVESGQCTCNNLGIGRQCNECPRGEWGFPACRPCECNGHSLTCHTETGVCENCEHNTAGDHCEQCKAGFFGDAKKGTPTDCQRCQCPGGSSENQFSPTCKVDNSTSPPTFSCDQCPLGYEGKQCEECSDGYYGNPLIPGGKCQKCNCNNNVDFSQKGYCDKRTGECLRCVNNTAGFFCGVCERGYYGNARNQTCKPCDCYNIGSNESSGSCDPSTGQCPCKTNVIGRSCDRCAPGHWDLGSGKGCRSCDCCAGGATSAQCNTLTGICECGRDFGGPRCCGCEDGFWGKPPAQCEPCDCNPSGSLRSQCDRETGQCPCRPGVSGRKCNKCKPDTTKTFPECENCHPCYHSWKITIDELEKLLGKIEISVNASGNVSVDYENDLNRLDEIRRRIREILGNRTTYPKHVEEIQNRITRSEEKVRQLMEKEMKTGKSVDESEAKTKEAKKEIKKLRKFLQRLNVLIDEYRRNLTRSIDEIPTASINESRKHLNISNAAVDISNNVRKTLEKSEKIRTEIEDKLPDYKRKKSRISKKLENYLLEFGTLDELVVRINTLVCGSPNDGCGGCDSDGCGQCGDSDNCDGATTVAEKALATAKKAENALREKERKANATLNEVIEAEFLVDESKKEAKIAFDLAKSIHSKASNTSDSVSGLIEEIYRFLNQSGADPDEVRRIAEFVLGKKLNISEEAIKILGKRIKDAVKKLTGIDAILEETSRDLASLEELKKQAIQANSSATDAAEIAKRVRTKLTEAENLQVKSDAAVKKAKRKIEQVEVILLEIEINLNKTLNKSVESVRLTRKMKTRLAPLEKTFEENEKMLVVAETEVKKAVDIANNSKTNANDLLKKFQEVNNLYNARLDEQERFEKRVEKLRSDVEGVQTSLTIKISEIQRYLSKRVEMEDLIDKLKQLEMKAKNTFCEIGLDSEYLLECLPDQPKIKRQADLCKQLDTDEK